MMLHFQSRKGSRKIYQRQRRLNWNKDEGSGEDEDVGEEEEKPMSKKINYAALEAIVGTSSPRACVKNTSSIESPAAHNTLPLSALLEPPPAPSERPNRLLEATLRVSEIGSDIFPANQGERVADQEDEVGSGDVIDAEYSEEEEEEEVEDWGAGDDLW